MKIRFLKGDNYIQLFNFSNGQALMLEKDAFVYRKEGPLLLDVSITNRCERQCDFCYRKSQSHGYDMPIEDYSFLLSQAKQCGVQQIAIGGGEPTLHPNFIDILKQILLHHHQKNLALKKHILLLFLRQLQAIF